MSAAFEFVAGPFGPGTLRVASFRGVEGISRLFAVDIVFSSSAEADDEAAVEAKLLGAPARLAIATNGLDPSRTVHGVIGSVVTEGTQQRDRRVFRARLVPRLWTLRRRRSSRIFQDTTVIDVVNAVLDPWNVPRRWQLVGSYPRRSYCVQYEETDYVFLRRLLSEEGIFFWFEEPVEESAAGEPHAMPSRLGSETLVLCDSAHLYPQVAGDTRLPYRPHGASSALAPGEPAVHRFALRRDVKPESVLMRDYDFRRPLLELRAEAALATAAPEPGAPTPLDPGRFQVYEHHAEYDETDATRDSAQVRLEQLRRRAHAGEGESSVVRLSPARRFSLGEHETASSSHEYVVTGLDHEGFAPEVAAERPMYRNRFTCVPSDVAFRPKAPRREARQVLETAIVVGPAGQEIATDALGRIKVQFHWDRDGRRDEHSSCWIRVAQAWAGAGFGAQFIPRIGMEVLVSFLGGDLDRPMVTGCVYNAANTPPFTLPDERTRSGFRTRSSSGGGGANELSFEDKVGAEQIRVVAERDLSEEVKHDRSASVARDDTLHVGGGRHIQVAGDQRESIDGDAEEKVSGDKRVVVEGTLRQEVAGELDTTVLNRSARVAGLDRRTVAGQAVDTFEGPWAVRVHAEHTLTLGTDAYEGHGEVQSTGTYVISTAKRAHVVSGESILLSCGESSIELTPSAVVVQGKSVTVRGMDKATVEGNGPAMNLGDRAELVAKEVRIYSKKASIELGDDASVRGERVLLNCSDSRPEGDSEGGEVKTVPFSLRLTDPSFKPHANKRYVLLASGYRYSGSTDGDGQVRAELPEEARVADVTLWIDEYPAGRKLTHTIRLRELAPLDAVAGVQERLKLLGYYDGAGGGDALDEPTRGALRWFQRDHGLPGTGEIDEVTKGKLQERYGH